MKLKTSSGQTKLCHHPPPSTTTHHYPRPSTTTHHQPKHIHHQPPSPSTSQNISTTTTRHQPKYIHHHPPPPSTTQNISTNTHQHPPTAKTFFLRNPFIRNLNSRPAIAKKLFHTWPSPLFLLHTSEMVLKSVNKPSYYAKLTVAHRCHGKTKKLRQNQKVTAKQKAMTKQKRRQHKTATAKRKIHGKIK